MTVQQVEVLQAWPLEYRPRAHRKVEEAQTTLLPSDPDHFVAL